MESLKKHIKDISQLKIENGKKLDAKIHDTIGMCQWLKQTIKLDIRT